MIPCDDLRVGGVLSDSGIAGGFSINNFGIMVEDWSSVWGYVGKSGSTVEINGLPGGITTGDLLGLSRFMDLNLLFTHKDRWGGLTEPTSEEQHQANLDVFLNLLRVQDQLLEVDMPDGTTRFTVFNALNPVAIAAASLYRRASFPIVSDYPYWKQGGAVSTDSIAGSDTLVSAGTAPVYDAILTFTGAGSLEHTTQEWEIEVTGACEVDLGRRLVTVGGVPAMNLLRRTRRDWAWFMPGGNALVATGGTVTVEWRDGYE